ncbi:ESF1 homolog [Ornithodoros turicata]|uniref:ESF1 homolog n=1 Tax=Ornithodoros turicata TaxID=34597 RepID=UPI0031396C4C
MDDERFKHITTDPRFRSVPRTEKKVKVDKRFQAMFDDKKFKLKNAMDKRGRPIERKATEDLKRFYSVSSDSDSSDEQEEKASEPEEDLDEESSEAESEDLAQKADKEPPDLARGVGNVESSSSEEDEEDEDEEADSAVEVEWGELDRDAPRSEDASRRLALCNLDWDKLQAQDLFVLLHSFKPPEGTVCSVKIYLSEFGRTSLAEEEKRGPLLEKTEKGHDEEALRRYHLKRLKYYYAVAECDSVDTADHLYKELDGREYEASGTCLDLRFVPDDMVFNDEPTSVAESLPDSYEPLNFTTWALQSSNVHLNWDEDDPRRARTFREAFKGDEATDNLDVYLASSSSDDDSSQGTTMEEQARKYRALLEGLEPEKKSKDDDMDMEVTWNPDLNKTVQEMVDRKQQQQPVTVFEQYLQKRKDKKKQKAAAQKEEQAAFSDDSVPSDVDLDDDFFRDEDENEDGDVAPKRKDEQKKKKKEKGKKKVAKEEPIDDKAKAELELLLMDEDDGRQHFNMKKIIKEKQRSKKTKKSDLKEKASTGPEFQVELADPRFAAVYNSHHFSIDPTDPHFKETDGMKAILKEKEKRRLQQKDVPPAKKMKGKEEEEEEEATVPPEETRQPSLTSLANSVRMKMKNRKNKSRFPT